MMRPGFDVWVHLGLIESPHQVNPSILPVSRILWHHFWHTVLVGLGVDDLFDRALLIHRTQALLTMSLITVGAAFSLSTLVQRNRVSTAELWVAAMFAAIIWLLMNGTASTARSGGPDAHFVQSWLIWYSINYQISLPLYFSSIGALLYCLSKSADPIRRSTAAIYAVSCIALATVVHAAETAYFLVFLGLIALVYLRGRQTWLLGGAILLLGGLVLWGATQQSYAMPAFLKLLIANDWGLMIERIHDFGQKLTKKDLNRIETGWHAMHIGSAGALGLAATLRWLNSRAETKQNVTDWRPWMVVSLTALMPLALLSPVTAGGLALITHLQIAWRFAFASLLFIGIPALGLLISSNFPSERVLLRQISLLATMLVFTVGTLVYSYQFERVQPSVQFAGSLIKSLSRKESYFGLTPLERAHLKRVESMRQTSPHTTPLCTDVFTAYYLFFIEKFHNVNLPKPLKILPGYRTSDPTCRFDYSPESLARGKSHSPPQATGKGK